VEEAREGEGGQRSCPRPDVTDVCQFYTLGCSHADEKSVRSLKDHVDDEKSMMFLHSYLDKALANIPCMSSHSIRVMIDPWGCRV
jgi:hypothetical protein